MKFLAEQVNGNMDVLMISKTKIDETFPVGNFVIDDYSTPYKLDRNSNGGGILSYIKEDIPSYLIATEKKPVESFYVVLNLRNENYLINCSYTAQKMKFSIKVFFSKCDQIRSFLRIWTHTLKNSLRENFFFCAVL